MSHMAKWLVSVSLTALLSGSVLTGCSLLPMEEEPLKPPLAKPVQEEYNTVKVATGTISRNVRGSGTFESTQTDLAQFTAQGGRVQEIFVKAGDTVKKGDLLIQLNVEGLDLQLKEAALALEKAKYAADQAKTNPGPNNQALRIAAMQMDIEQTKYDRLQQTFQNRQLRSKIDGQITFLENVKSGDLVSAYQTLAVVADKSQLRLTMKIDTVPEAKEVMVGMDAEIKISGGGTAPAKVVQTPSSAPPTAIKELADRHAKTLYLELTAPVQGITIGTFGEITIPLQKKDDVIKIPLSGLRSYLGRNFVQVLEDRRLREVDVETGIRSSTEVEISKGLTAGQEIVLQN